MDWNTKPKHCPFCGGTDIVGMETQWVVTSEDNLSGSDPVDEYQCRDCENRSFFV